MKFKSTLLIKVIVTSHHPVKVLAKSTMNKDRPSFVT